MRKPRQEKTQGHDAQDFLSAVQDAKPLKETVIPQGLAKPKPRPRKRIQRENNDSPAAADQPPLIEEAALPDERLSFRRPGVQDQTIKRLRRGLIPIQAEIDLHGLTQQDAWDMLREFLSGSRDGRHRCVRIIHGKGYRSGLRGPVLKSAVNTWLRRNHDVVAFTSARPIDGGAGALYVLLRA